MCAPVSTTCRRPPTARGCKYTRLGYTHHYNLYIVRHSINMTLSAQMHASQRKLAIILQWSTIYLFQISFEDQIGCYVNVFTLYTGSCIVAVRKSFSRKNSQTKAIFIIILCYFGAVFSQQFGTRVYCGSHNRHVYTAGMPKQFELEWKSQELDSEIYSIPCVSDIQFLELDSKMHK